MREHSKIYRLVESAVLLAVATVLSMVKLLDLPYGGSITACSGLPLLLIAYRHGTPSGLLAGLAYGLIQLLLGLNTLSYVTTPLSVAAVIVLDYLLAFAALGAGGLFRRGRSQGRALVMGAIFTCAVRYVFHVISGCTVWAGLSIPTNAALLYSLGYNATYMLPETIVLALGAWYFSCAVDVQGPQPTRAAPQKTSAHPVLTLVYKLVLLVTAIWDVGLIFGHLQDGETGEFAITGLAAVPWLSVGIITLTGAVLAAILCRFSRSFRKA